MQTLMDYNKEEALENILEKFDVKIDEITKRELSTFVFDELLEISRNSNNLKPSKLKMFSTTQVSIIFIYQELFEAHSKLFFNSCINTTKHKENISSLIHVACDFSKLYESLEDEEKVEYLNQVFVDELKKIKNDVEDNTNFKVIYKTLFNKDGSFSTQNHLLNILKIQTNFVEVETFKRRFLSKDEIFSLMVLFENYKSEELIKLYQHIKLMCNMHTSKEQITPDEIKSIANDYMIVKSREHLETFNHFFMQVCQHVKDYYLCQIDDKYIETSFTKISQEIKTPKWYDFLWIKKDTRLLTKNTIKIQKELIELQQDYSQLSLSSKIFENNFKVFSYISMLLNEYDNNFHTIEKLSLLLGHDLKGYDSVACMNIKNFYEKTDNPLEIEAINRVIIFWCLINNKSYLKKIDHKNNS